MTQDSQRRSDQEHQANAGDLIDQVRREAAPTEFAAAQQALEELRHERERRELSLTQRDRLASRVQALDAQLSAAREALRNATRAHESSILAHDAARRELELLWRSNSWRYTRPLREAGIVLRGAVRHCCRWMGISLGARQGSPAAGTPVDPPLPSSSPASTVPLTQTGARVLDELRQAVAEVRRG